MLVLAFAAPRAALGDLFFGENQSDTEWRELVSEHFRVIHPARSGALAERAILIAENAWEPVTSLAGGAPPGRIDIVIRDFSDRSSGLSYSTWPRIELEPYSLDRDVASVDFLRQVVLHEFTHIAMFYALGGQRFEWIRTPLAMENLPDWWVEGLASAVEKRASDPREEELVRMAAVDGELPRVRRQDSIDQGDRNDLLLIYRGGESKIRWLAERFGSDLFARVHHAMRPIPWSFDHALEEVTGMGEGEVDRRWREDLAASYPPAAPGGSAPEGAVPLEALERPLGAAWSARGDLAVAAVRDEDVWWTELYLAPAGDPGRLRLIDAGPVGRDLAWSPGGGSVAYARQVRTESNARIYDIFRYDTETGGRTRLTRGRRARSPAWLADGSAVAAIGYEPSDGSSHLLFISPNGGVEDRIPAPPGVRTLFDLAAAPDTMQIVFAGLTLNDERELFLFDLPSGTVRAVTENGDGEYEPAWGRPGTITLLRYRDGSPEWAEIAVEEGAAETHAATKRQVFDLARAPDGRFYEVASTGRYRSYLLPLEPADDGNRPLPPTPPWNTVELLPLPTDAPPPHGEAPIVDRPHRAWRSVRLRPEIGVNTITTDRIDLSIDELFADPLDRHVVSVEGDRRWDGRAGGASATYTNRAFFPTLRFSGGYREQDRLTGPWRDETATGALHLAFPVGGLSVASRLDLTFGFGHEDTRRSAPDSTDLSFQRSDLSAGFAWTSSVPRRYRLLSVGWSRAVDMGESSTTGERWTGALAFRRAVIRNDWYVTVSADAAAETGAEKVLLAAAPSGLSRPSSFAVGSVVTRYGAGFSWPLSEDLRFAVGPFYFERLTHTVRYREGRAWQREVETGMVRSVSTDLGLTLFSGHFVPFAGTETLGFTGGYARELTGDERAEWYFALESSIFSDRWSSERRR